MQEQMNNVSRQREILRKNQKENARNQKHCKGNFKKSLMGFTSRFDSHGKKIGQ